MDKPLPFPKVFWVANVIELFERLAYYGVYINLAVYLVGTVGLSDIENGNLLALFALARSWLPVAAGAFADRIGFRRSLLIAFSLYTFSYSLLYASPLKFVAYGALFAMALAGAFMKPIITGSVTRYSPSGRKATGFAIFYAIVIAGSVIGKTLAKIVRTSLSLRATMLTSVIASVVSLVTAALWFIEPPRESDGEAEQKPGLHDTVLAYQEALKNPRLVFFLLAVSGYYPLIEQFYQTFPVYMVRAIDANAPRELITLINPLSIALLQVLVVRLTKRLSPMPAMTVGILVGSLSMLTMGLYPTLVGAGVSFFVFAVAEMLFSPRYFETIASFAPKGREGLYMGLAIAPPGIGGLAGGVLSGRLIHTYLPKEGHQQPLYVWGTYAVVGVGCASLLALYGWVVSRQNNCANVVH